MAFSAEPHPSASIIVPAFNEERYLPATLEALWRASDFLKHETGGTVELIVVDDGSTDQTAAVASAHGACLVTEAQHNIAAVRNTGARRARSDVLVFVDADTIVPEPLLVRIAGTMSNPAVLGGAVDTVYRPKRTVVHLYLQLWRALGWLLRMAQGPTQFFRREAFLALGGYDERLYMGEDTDLFWRLQRMARQRGKAVQFIRDLRVFPSTRRFDHWPLWRTLIWTNPLWIALLHRSATAWRDWYSNVPR